MSNISFCHWIIFHCLCLPQFIHSPTDGHLVLLTSFVNNKRTCYKNLFVGFCVGMFSIPLEWNTPRNVIANCMARVYLVLLEAVKDAMGKSWESHWSSHMLEFGTRSSKHSSWEMLWCFPWLQFSLLGSKGDLHQIIYFFQTSMRCQRLEKE